MSETTRREFLAASLAAAPAIRPRPNILLLFPDQHRFDWTGANRDLPLRTPNLDGLRRRGVTLTNAVVPSPLCAPSRACLAAGKEYDRCRVPGNNTDYPLDQTTFYTLLRESGYHVSGCGKFDLHKKSPVWGLDGKGLLREWGFSDGIDSEGKGDAISSGAVAPKGPYMAYLHSRGLASAHVADFKRRKDYSFTAPTPLPEEAYCDNWVASNGLRLMRAFPRGKPWYMAVNFPGPHAPMDITRRMEERWRGVKFPPPHRNTQFPAETHLAIRQNYAAMIENIDRLAGVFLDEVRRRGELDNTLVVFSSDHGEMLGDHDRWNKVVPYQPSVGVPLAVVGPGVLGNLASPALVSTMDLAATFLDYGGVARPAGMDSRSLRPLIEGRERQHREFVRSGLNRWRMVWDGRYKLVRGFDPSAERTLFDLQEGPWEDRNLAPDRPDVVRRLDSLLT